MKREELGKLFDEIVVSHGFTFYSGTENEMDATLRTYPAAWLTPPVMKSKIGRDEGEIVYRTTLHLMALPEGIDNNPTWQNLERAALEIARLVAAHDAVVSLENTKTTPAKQALTNHGEVSLTLECDVAMWYYN